MKICPRVFLLGGLLIASLSRGAPPPDHIPWRNYEEPEFPPQLMSTVIKDGFATVVFTFDENGRITDRVSLKASHPAFVQAVFEAVAHWEIDPARVSHFSRREVVDFNFERHHSIVNLTQRDATKSAFNPYGDEKANALRTCREDELDFPVKLTTYIAPEYPPALKAEGVHGSATLSFVVDAEGRVRVPAVTDANDPAFGEALFAVARQWRFTGPQLKGRPAQVMMERTVSFGARRP